MSPQILKTPAAQVSWKTWAKLATFIIACEKSEFTSGDVWEFLAEHKVPSPDEPRAMGPIMLWAVNGAALIEPTTLSWPSTSSHSKNYRRPQLAYSSLVYGDAAPEWPEVTLPDCVL